MQFDGNQMQFKTQFHGTRILTRLSRNSYEICGKGEYVRCIHEAKTDRINHLIYPEGPSFGIGKLLNGQKVVSIEPIKVPKCYDHIYHIVTSD